MFSGVLTWNGLIHEGNKYISDYPKNSFFEK